MADPKDIPEVGSTPEKAEGLDAAADALNDVKPGLGTLIKGLGKGPLGLIGAAISLGQMLKKPINDYSKSLDEAGAKAAQSPGNNTENLQKAWNDILIQHAKYKAELDDSGNSQNMAQRQAADAAVTAVEKPKAVADASFASIIQESESLKKNLPDLANARDVADAEYTKRVKQINNDADIYLTHAETEQEFNEIQAQRANELAKADAVRKEADANYNNALALLKQIKPGGNVYNQLLNNAATADQRFNDAIGQSPANQNPINSSVQMNAAAVESAIQTLQQSFQAYHQTLMDGLKQLNAEIQQSTADIRTEIQTIQHQLHNHGP